MLQPILDLMRDHNICPLCDHAKMELNYAGKRSHWICHECGFDASVIADARTLEESCPEITALLRLGHYLCPVCECLMDATTLLNYTCTNCGFIVKAEASWWCNARKNGMKQRVLWDNYPSWAKEVLKVVRQASNRIFAGIPRPMRRGNWIEFTLDDKMVDARLEFGSYQGKLMTDIAKSEKGRAYLRWMLTQQYSSDFLAFIKKILARHYVEEH